MVRSANQTKGVLCLEADWNDNLTSQTSVQPLLEILWKSDDYRMPYIHRKVATKTELEYYLRRWALKKYKGYPVLYLAFHGTPGSIWLGDKSEDQGKVQLEQLAACLKGKCAARIVHFGSCKTFRIPEARMHKFLEATAALAVSGYDADVDWMLSAAFELVFLSETQSRRFDRRGAEIIRKKCLGYAPGLAEKLHFRMAISDG